MGNSWSIYSSVPSFIPIFASGLLHHVRFSRQEKPYRIKSFAGIGVALGLWLLPPHSFTCWWKHTTWLLCQWTHVVTTSENKDLNFLINGGPLGKGCGKLCEVIAGCILWKLVHHKPLPLQLGPMPSASTGAIVAVLSVAVNVTLSLWSRQLKSRGDHDGVNSMVESSLGRKLLVKEQIKLAVLALINAVCEEVCSRGFWYHEYQQQGGLSPVRANLSQSLCFGIWHYHGIPSGLTGVGLTFVYGLIMGLLCEYDGPGLLLPVLTHAVADYHIFATIARQQQHMRTE